MTSIIIDDHLLRDVLAGDVTEAFEKMRAPYALATTNLYHVRLCRSIVSARGGQLTGTLSAAQRRALGHVLTELPEWISIVPMQANAFRVAELMETHHLSTLGAEALATAELLDAPLAVWAGDDGPRIRAAAATLDIEYRVVAR